MKISANILALCTLSPVASAFTVQRSANFGTALRQADNSYSYLGNLNEDVAAPSTPSPSAPSATATMAKAGEQTSAITRSQGIKATQDIMGEMGSKVTVQGGALRTCSFDESVDRVTVYLRTEGRPLNANVDLWQGPDNAPQKMSVYLEDGSLRPFRATIESPGASNAIAIRNTGQMEFPLTAGLEVDMTEDNCPANILLEQSASRTVQGGAVYTTPFPPSVQSVQVALKSDGRPLNARVELLQGPNNNKQVMEIYTEDGYERPFFVIIDTPGNGNVVRIVNTATVEFPLVAAVEPYIVDDGMSDSGPGSMMWS